MDVLPDLQNVLAISLDRTGILAVKRGLIARLELIQHTHSRSCAGLLGICRFIARDCCGKCGPFLIIGKIEKAHPDITSFFSCFAEPPLRLKTVPLFGAPCLPSSHHTPPQPFQLATPAPPT